jgi:hypothetical protein
MHVHARMHTHTHTLTHTHTHAHTHICTQKQVKELIRLVEPEVVGVELCKDRLPLLINAESDIPPNIWHCRRVRVLLYVCTRLCAFQVNQNHVHNGVYMEILVGKSQKIQSYTVHVYGFGQPYVHCVFVYV